MRNINKCSGFFACQIAVEGIIVFLDMRFSSHGFLFLFLSRSLSAFLSFRRVVSIASLVCRRKFNTSFLDIVK